VGTRVAVDGPYGVCTPDLPEIAAGRKVLFVVGGVGIAPARAMLEVLPPSAEPVVLYRAHSADQLVHHDELVALAAHRNGRVLALVGPSASLAGRDPFSPAALTRAVPDLVERVAVLCGPRSITHRSSTRSHRGRARPVRRPLRTLLVVSHMSPAPHRRPSLARRALPALALTGASGFLLNTLDHPSAVVDAVSTDQGITAVPDPADGTADTAGTVAGSMSPAPSAATPATTTASNSTASNSTAAASTAATVASTVPATPTCTTYTGPSVSTKWGPVQVQAAVAADGTICSVDAIVTPDSKSKSVAINNRAVPVLNERVVAAQGTDVDGISGATITVNAYRESLQAILDAVAAGSVG
jgi:uncharacterized protein with FMN-binding domain